MAMILEPERAARLVADRLAGSHTNRIGLDAPTLPAGVALEPDWIVRRTLEELGIHCEADSGLQDLKGFMIASPRGAEIVVSDRLKGDERLAVYAHLLAHALLEQREDGEEGNFFSRLEYVEGREPASRKGAERKAEMVADALARAILKGRLDGAPQYTYRQRREPSGPKGLRPRLGRFWLELCHRVSLMLFWHSPKYQRLRARREMSYLVRRVEGLVRVAYAC